MKLVKWITCDTVDAAMAELVAEARKTVEYRWPVATKIIAVIPYSGVTLFAEIDGEKASAYGFKRQDP